MTQEYELTKGPSVASKRTREKPYPSIPMLEEEDEARGTHPTRRSRSKRLAELSAQSDVRTAKDDPPPGAKPVKFGAYVPSGSLAGQMSDGAADISGADSKGVALHSGNWCIDRVVGGVVTRFDPTTVFPAGLAGGFCCDQVVLYVPKIDRFVWYMQHKVDGAGTGAFRLAIAKPQDVQANFQSAWTYWDFPASTFNQTNLGFDYPDLAFTNRFLIGTTQVVGKGRMVFRIDLEALQGGGSVSADYTDPTLAPTTQFHYSHLCQHGGDRAMWAGHVDTAKVNVFALPDASTSYSSREVAIGNWPRKTYSSKGPTGTDWLDAPWADDEISGTTRRDDELWLAWTATAGKSAGGGFDFPNAHVRVVAIDINTWKTVQELQVWNNDYAFGYPFLDSNSAGEVGIIVGWGGKNNHANTAEGILGDFVVWFHNASDVTPDRFGDYITIRRSGVDGRQFAAFGYFAQTDATRPSGYLFNPYYSVISH